MYTVKLYQPGDFDAWNQFVATAKNATFLFHRNFMEYHNDRFKDFSLLVFKNEKLVALLPANRNGNEVFSHQGLTYGGVLLQQSIGVTKVELIFEEIILFLQLKKINHLTLKTLPFIYHDSTNFELEPLLFKKGAKIIKREQGFCINYNHPLSIHKTKLKNYRKGNDFNFTITENTSFSSFWKEVLIPKLEKKHNSQPVHTIEEMELLQSKFPKNIIQYCIFKDGILLAGITVFKTGNVIKSQYGANSNEGEKYRALDYLFISIIEKYKELKYSFFDMGVISDNYSLLKQKEELGGSQYIQDVYKLKIT